MPAYVLRGIVTSVGPATLDAGGTRYDYLEIAQQGGRVCRLCDVFVPARLEREIVLHAIGEFSCRESGTGPSASREILDFRRADGEFQ